MTTSFETDVLIIGGGPAGTSAALSLLHYCGLEVIVADKSNFTEDKVGEHVTASIFDLLNYLKVPIEKLKNEAMIPAHGTVSYWGSDQPYFVNSIHNAQGDTFQLDRSLFEMELVKQVSLNDGIILPRTRYKSAKFNPETNLWLVDLEHEEKGQISIKCRFLVDASGRNAGIARKNGIPIQRYDQLVGVGHFFHCDNRTIENTQILETTEFGWVYSAVLPGNKVVAVIFSDADLVAKNNFKASEHFLKGVLQTNAIKKRIQPLSIYEGDPWVRSAHSQNSKSAEHPNFISVGDAAASYDPMSSMGIGFAMTSGTHAAHFILAYLNGEKDAIKDYDDDISANMQEYWKQRMAIYSREQRWKESPFWSRRNNAAQDNNLVFESFVKPH